MAKRNKWNVGDIIHDKESEELYEIILIREEKDGTHNVFCESLKTGLGLFDPLIFMDSYWINLGNSKYWRILYGTKDKDSTNQLLDKSK